MSEYNNQESSMEIKAQVMQSYPARALDRRLQEDWVRDAREGPREQNFVLLFSFSLHSSSPTFKLLSMAFYGEISQDKREKIREEERRKIQKELRKEKHASYKSHNSCKSLSEELRDYYEGRHRSHLRPHSHRREKERKPQEANINLPYIHGKDNVEANLDWKIRVEQQLKRKSTSKSYGSHSYPKKDQGQGILGVTPSMPKDDKGKTIEKQPHKDSMQEKTSSMKCFKCLGRGHITSQCPTKKTMIMRGQDIYSSQDEATTSPSSSESEEAKEEESSEEIYPQEEGQPLMLKEECKEVSVSTKRLAKKERNFEIKTNIKEISPFRQPPHFLLCKKTLVSIVTPLGLEFIPQVKELLETSFVAQNFVLLLSFSLHSSSPTFKLLSMASYGVIKIQEAKVSIDEEDSRATSSNTRALDIRLQEDWARDARECPRVLMSLRWRFQSSFFHLHSAAINLQEAKDSIDEEDPRSTSFTWSYIIMFKE
ncbi:hypothetical protein HKD37_09G025364 [Glycine soja]